MISIIIPAYNAAETLPACLEALHKQTQLPDEIIVVDDGSQDQTIQVAHEYGVHLFEQPHQGPAAARNLGINQARGDIVLFTDADCKPVPTWVAEMIRPFSDPLVMGVKGSYKTNQQENVARLVQYEFEERYDRLEGLTTIDFIDTSAAAFRMTVFREMGGFDPAFPMAVSEDADFSYRLSRAGYRLIFNRKAVVYHLHPSTWSKYLRRKIKFGYWRMVVYRQYPDKALHDSYTPQLLKTQLFLIYLIFGLAGLGFIIPPLLIGSIAFLIGLILSGIPFVGRFSQHDKKLVLPGMMFTFMRALALAIGVVGGIVGMLFFHPTIKSKKGGKLAV